MNAGWDEQVEDPKAATPSQPPPRAPVKSNLGHKSSIATVAHLKVNMCRFAAVAPLAPPCPTSPDFDQGAESSGTNTLAFQVRAHHVAAKARSAVAGVTAQSIGGGVGRVPESR